MPGVAARGMMGVNSGYVPNFFDTMSMSSVICASFRSTTMKTLRTPACVYDASGANP